MKHLKESFVTIKKNSSTFSNSATIHHNPTGRITASRRVIRIISYSLSQSGLPTTFPWSSIG